MKPSGTLAGLKIIEMAGIGPAPFCAMMLADHGAEVIRIVPPGVDLNDTDVGWVPESIANAALRRRPR